MMIHFGQMFLGWVRCANIPNLDLSNIIPDREHAAIGIRFETDKPNVALVQDKLSKHLDLVGGPRRTSLLAMLVIDEDIVFKLGGRKDWLPKDDNIIDGF